jgi:hypothetical protein
MRRNARNTGGVRPHATRPNGTSLCAVLPALALGAFVAGCSDIYFDRRDGVTFYGGDATATNVAVQTIDPWPPAAATRKIAAHGELMQKAAERYRTNKVTPLRPIGTSSVQLNQAPGSGTQAAGGTPASP